MADERDGLVEFDGGKIVDWSVNAPSDGYDYDGWYELRRIDDPDLPTTDAPTPKQREEREEIGRLLDRYCREATDPDVSRRRPVKDARDHYVSRIISRLRTHSPEEPVGYVVCLHKPESSPKIWMTLGDSTECTPERLREMLAEATANNARRESGRCQDDGYRYRVHPIGQALTGQEEDANG